MESSDRTERLLALLLVNELKSSSQQQKALQLSIAGFTNSEIADILQTNAAVIAQHLYTARRQSKKKASRRS